MADGHKVAVSSEIADIWGAALKESGFEYKTLPKPEDLSQSLADCALVDARRPDFFDGLQKLKSSSKIPILSVVKSGVDKEQIQKIQRNGLAGYVSETIPAEELMVRLHAIVEGQNQEIGFRETRSARRIWFQQLVEFRAFDRNHTAWSTTLSETGIFLRTSLSFPLYSVIHLKFDFMGEKRTFEADAVIVRQEVEGPIRGIGVMFQNLRGESVALLESFLQLHRST